MDFSASKCRGVYLHKFATITDNGESVLERCVKCGKRNVVKAVKGQVDIVRYSQQHQREFLIPQHRLFGKEFQSYKKNRAGKRAHA